MYAVIDRLNDQAFGPFESEADAQAMIDSTYALEGGDDGSLHVQELIQVNSADEIAGPRVHDPLCGLEGVPCPDCAEAMQDPGMAIEGVTPPAYRTHTCSNCGVSEREGLLDAQGRCEECSDKANERPYSHEFANGVWANAEDCLHDDAPETAEVEVADPILRGKVQYLEAHGWTRSQALTALAAYGSVEAVLAAASGTLDIDQLQQDGAQDTLRLVEEESERRRQAIDHLLRWKGAALEILTDGAFAAIDQRAREKAARDEAPLPLSPADVPVGYGDLVSTVIWFPVYQTGPADGIVVCQNCQTAFETHDKTTGACSETLLRAAYGDR